METAIVIIIVAARSPIDQQALEALLAQYDNARTHDEREQVAAEIETLVGAQVRGMLAHQLSGLIDVNDLPALTTEMISKALAESGNTRLRRGQDVTVDHLVERLRAGRDEAARRLIAMLPDELRSLLQVKFLKATDQQMIVDFINDFVLRTPDLASRLGQPPQAVTRSMPRRTADNAAIMARLFDDAIAKVPAPKRDLVGYISSFLLPEAKRNLLQQKSPQITDAMRANWRQIQPVIEALRGKIGRQPEAEEVHAELRLNAEQYRDAIRWFETQIKKIQPHNPFPLKDPGALAYAKTLLREHGYSEDLWAKGGKYYVPKSALKGLSLATVKTLMGTPGLGVPATPSAEHLLPTTPAALSAPDVDMPDAPSWALEVGQEQGRGSDLYRAIVQSLYPDPESAERQIGELLAENASADTIDSYIRKVEVQDPDLADFLRTSWQAIARQIDARVTEALRDPSIIGPIARQFGFSPSQILSMRDCIRRQIFGRNTQRICRLGT